MLGMEISGRNNIQRLCQYGETRPLNRVELHVHLDGTIRPETIFEIAKRKNIALPGRGTFKELVQYVELTQVEDLERYLSRFDIIYKCLKGDLQSLERLGYEFVEDCNAQGVIYCESGFCPHLHVPEDILSSGSLEDLKASVWDITGAVIKGLIKGSEQFKSRVNLIITCVRGTPQEWFTQSLELALDKSFHGGRICGVDIAGATPASFETHKDQDTVQLFDGAVKHGIHRTVHAESCGPSEVTRALDLLHAERIGHGYSIVDDPIVYERIRKEHVHLECCPWCSILTAAVMTPLMKPHPIVQFFRDGLNVSISTDDPILTGTRMDDEYNFMLGMGVTEEHLVQGNFNAAQSCFLPEQEKKDLVQALSKNYGKNYAKIVQ